MNYILHVYIFVYPVALLLLRFGVITFITNLPVQVSSVTLVQGGMFVGILTVTADILFGK